jgi:hypothetical protein
VWSSCQRIEARNNFRIQLTVSAAPSKAVLCPLAQVDRTSGPPGLRGITVFVAQTGNYTSATKEYLMQRLKVMILAAMAVFALGATMAASAYAGVEALDSTGKATSAEFKGTSPKKTTLSTLGNSLEVLCGQTTTEGTLAAGGKLGTFHIKFEKCDTSLGGECTGLGDTAGTILALGTQHLATNSTLTVGYILFLTEHLHFTCTVFGIAKLFLVLGEQLCQVEPINTSTSTLTVKCVKGTEPGDPSVTSYENDEGKAATLTNALQSSEGDTTETMSAELGEGVVTVTPTVRLDI